MSCEKPISPEELSLFTFSTTDAILLTDPAQVQFLCSTANSSVQQCLLMPLSVQAYTAAIRKQLPVRPHFEFIDFPECKRQYQKKAEALSRTWLKEMGLKSEVDGIDLAEFDAPNQFLLFNLASYLERTVSTIVQKLQHIETFYVVSAEERLPLDFYFDSDVPASLLYATCEGLGRKVRQIAFANRALVFPQFPHRPITRQSLDSGYSRLENVPAARKANCAGFAPATVRNSQQIVDALNELGFHTVLFGSTWGKPLMFSGQIASEYQLSDEDVQNTQEWANVLRELWTDVKNRRHRSTLPRALITSGHLHYQLEYVVTRRWLSYVNLIRRAQNIVSRVPLKLFIHSETFTAEGAILAHCYREAGTPILVAPHSRWPCDRNWSTRKPSDASLVFSRRAARKIAWGIGASKTFVVKPVPDPTYRSLLYAPNETDVVRTKRQLAGKRKIVILATNALELLSVPFTNLQQHLKTMSFIAQTLRSEQDSVLLAIRTKPGPVGEDPIIYKAACGFSEESVAFLNGMTFSQCLDLADCVLGVNIPTNGYFEVIERDVPLLHVQTTEAVTFHPDLPGAVLSQVNTDDSIWPALKSILFDSAHRTEVLEKQKSFLQRDQRENYFCPGKSAGQVLEQLSGNRELTRLSWMRHRRERRTVSNPNSEPIRLRDFDVSTRGAGSVDDLLLGSDGSVVVVGWSADLITDQPAKVVHIFAGDEYVASGSPALLRPDVARALGSPGTRYSGFEIRVLHCDKQSPKSLEAFGELSDGTLYPLGRPQSLRVA